MNGSRWRSTLYAILFALILTSPLALGCGAPGAHSTGATAAQVPSAPSPPFPASADEPPRPHRSDARSRPLRVGTSGDYPPFSDWPTGANEPRGFSIDVARRYALDSGREIEWVRFRWPELAEDLAARRFDLALSGITVRPDRSIAGRFSLPLTTSGAVALVEQDSDLTQPSQLDAPEFGIAVNGGGHLERVARQLFPRARIEPSPRNDLVLPQLGQRGIRAVLTDTLEAPLWKATRPGLREIGPLTEDRKAAWFPIPPAGELDDLSEGRAPGPIREPEIRHFDRWLLAAEASGQLAAWRAAHRLPSTRTADPKHALLASLDDRLALMIDVARAKHTLGTPIEDRTREALVVEAALRNVDEAARQLGLEPPTPESVAPIFRAQIEAAKAIQRRWLESQPSQTIPPDETARRAAQADLSERIRPALIDLGQRIASLLVVAAGSSPADPADPTVQPDHERTALAGLSYAELCASLARHDLPEVHLRSLHTAVVTLSRSASPSPPPPSAAPDITPSA